MNLSVKRIGSGSPVRVMLHGFGSNSGTFTSLLPFLIGNGTMVLVDLPGHGRSDVPESPPYLAEISGAIADAISKHSLKSFELVGHSLGGLVATHVASAMPKNVTRLSLIACAGVGPHINLSFFHSLLAAKGKDELLPFLSVAYAEPPANLAKVSRTVLAWLDRPGVRDYLRRLMTLVPVCGADIAGAVAKGIPVSAIWGAKDSVLPLGNTDALPAEVQLVVLPEAGHALHIEEPAETARFLLRDLEE
jgi:pyruvate dehydrogenase E2 component (dihydrolipoamide acetyltransferase)